MNLKEIRELTAEGKIKKELAAKKEAEERAQRALEQKAADQRWIEERTQKEIVRMEELIRWTAKQGENKLDTCVGRDHMSTNYREVYRRVCDHLREFGAIFQTIPVSTGVDEWEDVHYICFTW